MGAPIARNLATAGFGVRAWNRTRDKADPLADSGVTVTDSPAEAVDGADILLTMLLDATAVRDSVADVLDRAPKLWLQCSTVGLSGTTMLSSLADKHGIVYVDAPVLGTRQPAEDGELTVLAA